MSEDPIVKRAEMNLCVGDLISYRAVWADVAPHQARVDHVTDRGPVVLDEPPPRGSGMPLTHLVTWDRVIGRIDA